MSDKSSIKCRFMAGKSIEQKGGSTSVSPVDCSLSPCKQCPALWVLVNHQAAIQQEFLGFSPIYDQKTSEVWTAEHVNNNTSENPWKIPTSHDIHGFPIKKNIKLNSKSLWQTYGKSHGNPGKNRSHLAGTLTQPKVEQHHTTGEPQGPGPGTPGSHDGRWTFEAGNIYILLLLFIYNVYYMHILYMYI